MKDNPLQVNNEKNNLTTWIEFITPKTAKVLAYYDHPYRGKYAAVTQNSCGKGLATYIGCFPSSDFIEKI
ncbi:beta-galactosidase trimerization domain-containing protein [Clostridium sp. PL3]|uniref:Beta-galactosidase trimerization domain-containing protein n=1 Tax=Clostridium thailandense TaxID=2794346 RepID=A0A949TZG2_9CLOT|nr:beta-galactosidase trimerization domain-containing protein [Clostridium thailandense]MBV7274465.1 beta-galactosidase trimerization domain-containing protein [Clostridium thailandense]